MRSRSQRGALTGGLLAALLVSGCAERFREQEQAAEGRLGEGHGPVAADRAVLRSQGELRAALAERMRGAAGAR